MKPATTPSRLIRADGTEEEIVPSNGVHFTFEELYPLIETDQIEMLSLSNGKVMLIDEDAKVRASGEKPRNGMATLIMAGLIREDDYIAGNAVVCDRSLLR